ncbi:MAG: hypothetical protein U0736_25900 [Gemmataceae bacterium]
MRMVLTMAVTAALVAPTGATAETIWVEGEKPVKATVNRHPWWYDQVKRDQLSGGDFITHWNDKRPGQIEYRVTVKEGGRYEFWARTNPVQTSLSYQLNDGKWVAITTDKDAVGSVNIAADNRIDLRFLAWVKVGPVELKKGANTVRFWMDSKNNNHGMLDCFVFSTEPFRPRGILKPNEVAKLDPPGADAKDWFAFDPPADSFRADSGIDLRSLNEKMAGENGVIGVKGGQFIRTGNGQPIRFWAVNGPSSKGRDDLKTEARMLAKYGVNLARVHHGYYDDKGTFDPDKVQHAHDVVEALKAEGIYSYFSIYFPLWLRPGPDTPWLKGYDGTKHPFAALYFNKDFQDHYRGWWKALLLTPNKRTGKRLIDDPAIAGLEIINEDSYFFWTFDAKNIPDAQMRILERQFGDWLVKKYGSLDRAFAAWKGQKVERDNPAEGRVGFRPLWNMANERTARDRDAARFLVESQRGFYQQTYQFLRELGFKGVITASNWTTADPRVLGPLEKLTYTVGDFIDRHGYFSCHHQGDQAAWSVRDGHTYADRSALRFDPEVPGKPKLFAHPGMDPHYDGKPSMISETTWCRPNRYRSEAPLYLAAYGALQDSGAIVHFALDGARWGVKPNFFMQPWTLRSPAMVGQFPAAALIYRKGLVTTGDLLVDLHLKVDDLLDLKGTPLPQDASLDELRLKDVTGPTALKPGGLIDPLVHYAGRTNVLFTRISSKSVVKDLRKYIDRDKRTVRSSTGELLLDYSKGILTVDAVAVQGVSGDLKAAGTTELKDVAVSSPLTLGHIVAVSLDDRPLATSGKILVQVMSEERATGFRTEPAGDGVQRIISIGEDPWQVRKLAGTVRFKRADAGELKVTALDGNGNPAGDAGKANDLTLRPDILYYLIQK